MSGKNTDGFVDAEGYDLFMGGWSRQVGEVFLDWLSPAPGLRWVDVGCGSGALTELVVDRYAPAGVAAIDPAPAQAEFTRRLFSADPRVRVRVGDAEGLPYAAGFFDLAVMGLVIFFVPHPDRAVLEMARVVRSGGQVATYGWDLLGGGFPYDAVRAELEVSGIESAWPPSPAAAGLDELTRTWTDAGLGEVEVRTIEVEQSYPDFETYWRIVRSGPRVGAAARELPESEKEAFADRLRTRLADEAGVLRVTARANAVRGRVA